MTLASEFRLLFAVESVRVFRCNKCFSLVAGSDREAHRKAQHGA